MALTHTKIELAKERVTQTLGKERGIKERIYFEVLCDSCIYAPNNAELQTATNSQS